MANGKSMKKQASRALVAIRPMVAGIDVGSKEHWVCGPATTDNAANVRVFRSTTAGLEELADWLLSQCVESVAMESTYIYWIPVYELLEARGIDVVLVNARTLHNVPGRKTDMSDCQWLQLLHSCGLLRASFRPQDAICRMRALHRQMANLVEERSKCVQWMQKALDQMNVQVHRALADITGTTGISIVRAIVDGERNPRELAKLRDRRCRKSQDEIAEYLTGTWREEHLYNLESALRLYDVIDKQIADYEARLQTELERLRPPARANEPVPSHPNPAKEKVIQRRGDQASRTVLWRVAGVDLTHIDGISVATARVVLTEIGLDLTAFPTEKHFVSWLRLCPRRAISGGKQLSKKPNGTGATRVAAALRMAALSLGRSKTALGAEYRRIARYKGGAVAVFAVARKLAQLIFRMLRFGQDYVDIGAADYEARFKTRRIAGLSNTAKALGFDIVPRAAESMG
jgi:transposase